MEKCSCYREEQVPYTWVWSLDGKPKDVAYTTVCRCNGTKEREECSCGGDEAKCNFYEDVREKGRQMNTTFIPGSTVWVVERDEDDYVTDYTGYMTIADIGDVVVASGYINDATELNDNLYELIEETKQGFGCSSLNVFPKEDCYVTKEYAKQAYDTEAREERQMLEDE